MLDGAWESGSEGLAWGLGCGFCMLSDWIGSVRSVTIGGEQVLCKWCNPDGHTRSL